MCNELCKCGKVSMISCPNDDRCGKPNNKLPVGNDNSNESINALRRATGCAKELAEKAVRFSNNFEEQINYVKTNGPKF